MAESIRRTALLTITLVVITALHAATPPAAAGQGIRKRIAVMPVAASPSLTTTTGRTRRGGATQTTSANLPPPEEFARGLTEMLTTSLVQTERFVVIERAAIDDILLEQERATEGLMAEGRGAQSGAMLGAQVLIRAAVTSYAFESSSSGGAGRILKGIKALEGLGISRSKEKATVVIDIRLYDAETGQVLASESAEGEAVSTETSIETVREEADAGFTSSSTTPLGEAARQAIERAVSFVMEKMEAVSWEGRIAAVDVDEEGQPALLYLNAGSRIGLSEGTELTILKPGRTIKDPETGVVLGRTRDRVAGRCTIIEVSADLAIATILEGDGFEVGDVVRPASDQ